MMILMNYLIVDKYHFVTSINNLGKKEKQIVSINFLVFLPVWLPREVLPSSSYDSDDIKNTNEVRVKIERTKNTVKIGHAF